MPTRFSGRLSAGRPLTSGISPAIDPAQARGAWLRSLPDAAQAHGGRARLHAGGARP